MRLRPLQSTSPGTTQEHGAGQVKEGWQDGCRAVRAGEPGVGQVNWGWQAGCRTVRTGNLREGGEVGG